MALPKGNEKKSWENTRDIRIKKVLSKSIDIMTVGRSRQILNNV